MHFSFLFPKLMKKLRKKYSFFFKILLNFRLKVCHLRFFSHLSSDDSVFKTTTLFLFLSEIFNVKIEYDFLPYLH